MLILTAIVVSVSTTAVAFALIIRIYGEFGSIEEDRIMEAKFLSLKKRKKGDGLD